MLERKIRKDMNIYDLGPKAAKFALEFCIKTFGTKPGLEVPKIIVHRTPSPEGLFGCYDSAENIIHVYRIAHTSFVEAMDTIVHEYTHYLQNLDAYYMFEKTGTSYDENPYEIEARNFGAAYKYACKRYVAACLAM